MRITLIAIYLIFFFITGFIPNLKILFTTRKEPQKAIQMSNSFVRHGFRVILRLAGVRTVVTGTENLPEGTALFVSNHRSYFDILTTHVALHRPVGYIAKAEMINIPFLARWMKNIGCLFIDRSDSKSALKTMMSGIKILKNDYCSLYVFPEGTRGHSDEMHPFKKGCFVMAQKSHVPIVPIGITGTDDVFENNGWFRKVRGKKVYLNIGEPIYYDQLEDDTQKHIDGYVQDIVEQLIAQNPKPKKFLDI